MGHLTNKEAACYRMRDLTSRRIPPPEQGPNLQSQPQIARVEVARLPVEWAIYEKTEKRFIPICTWCDLERYYCDKNGDIQKGNFLFLSGQTQEIAEALLLMHLEQIHNKHHVVSPFEPYGLIYEQSPMRIK